MAMRSFRAPALPLPREEYDRQYFEQLLKVIQIYFRQLDSENPLHLEGLVLTDLPEDTAGLPNFSLFRDGRDVKILLPGDTYPTGVSSISGIGSVTVTIS
tara:strand:- start:10504 stop:10803 length:300 start_codon:yes stop_codon:yes gene_type:complete